MRRAITTVSMNGTLRDKLEAIAAARFDAVQLFESDLSSSPGGAREVRQIADGLGLALDLYQPFRDFEGMPEDLFRRSLERAERKFDLMEQLGAPMMLVCSNTWPHASSDPELAAAQLHELADLAAQRDLRIGFEALAWGRWVNLYGQAWKMVERANHAHLGLVLDSFHTLSMRDDPAGIRDIPGEKIFFVQMADAPLMAMDVLQWARHHRNSLGQGRFNLEEFFEHALRAGYTGSLSLDIFNDVFRATPNRRMALDTMRSLLFLESRVRARLADRGDRGAAHVLKTVDLFDPPAAAPLDGFAFIEFGVDDATSGTLGARLEQMGFTRYGRHRTKAVTLYRQGDISIVLNAQPGSDARARFEEQGAGVGVLGLETADPLRAANRGSALLSARRDSPRGAQELELPAIVAPGGMIVQFVPRGQKVEPDFVSAPHAAAGQASGHLKTIDHVAMTLAIDQFDTWLLFSKAVLGLAPGESLELADPFGLIRSAGVSDAERHMRLVLNVPIGERTRTALQVTASGRSGGSVHHIAFDCEDIFATVETLRTRGVPFVPIAAEYYDDLVARFGLDQRLVDRMRALDILFDTAGGGRYFHAYSEPFEDRFFFEIVQRDGRYDGYGAINAPARVAALGL